MILTIMPMAAMLDPFRPYWVALVLVYWCLETQDFITLGTVFIIGLVLDLLTASLLGQHALSLVIMIYLVTRFRARLLPIFAARFDRCEKPVATSGKGFDEARV